ncbi:MAG: hypothetical protein KTR33_00745 [Gammaproteobacteria bacterium]|nr:hypothetical protein [Gammaproteobacteria bacterium]
MAEFLLIMKGTGPSDGWEAYIEKLIESGLFRGGSAFGNSLCLCKSDSAGGVQATASTECTCTGTGYMRFEAATRAEVEALIPGNPVYESGDEVELHELVLS